MNQFLRRSSMAVALCAVLWAAGPAQAAVIDSITWNDGTTDVTSTSSSQATITKPSTLVSFVQGTDIYASIVGTTTVNDTGGLAYAKDETPVPASVSEALSDNRIDTGATNIPTSDFLFGSNLTSQDQAILFIEVGGTDTTDLQLIDGSGSLIGNEVTLNSWSPVVAKIDMNIKTNLDLNAQAISVSDFGVATLSDAAGVRLLTGGKVDPVYIGVATVPEPATMGLLALGGLAMIRRRKA